MTEKLPVGLCGNREDHEPHLVEYAAVADGPMWCHADQSQRLPHKLEIDIAERANYYGVTREAIRRFIEEGK